MERCAVCCSTYQALRQYHNNNLTHAFRPLQDGGAISLKSHPGDAYGYQANLTIHDGSTLTNNRASELESKPVQSITTTAAPFSCYPSHVITSLQPPGLVTSGGGAITSTVASILTVMGSTVAGNSAGGNGGGIAAYWTTLTLEGNLIKGNTAGGTGNDISDVNTSPVECSSSSCPAGKVSGVWSHIQRMHEQNGFNIAPTDKYIY